MLCYLSTLLNEAQVVKTAEQETWEREASSVVVSRGGGLIGDRWNIQRGYFDWFFSLYGTCDPLSWPLLFPLSFSPPFSHISFIQSFKYSPFIHSSASLAIYPHHFLLLSPNPLSLPLFCRTLAATLSSHLPSPQIWPLAKSTNKWRCYWPFLCPYSALIVEFSLVHKFANSAINLFLSWKMNEWIKILFFVSALSW